MSSPFEPNNRHPAMQSHTTPGPAGGPCWHCTAFGGMVFGPHARCVLVGVSIQASPAGGCAFWQREVGADDEPGPPASARGGVLIAVVQPVPVEWAP